MNIPTIPLWRLIIGGLIFCSGLIILVQALFELTINSTRLLSLDFIFALWIYILSILAATAFIFPAKDRVPRDIIL